MHLDFATSLMNLVAAIIALLVAIVGILKKRCVSTEKQQPTFRLITNQVWSHQWLTAAP